jgi:hypothetical protein
MLPGCDSKSIFIAISSPLSDCVIREIKRQVGYVLSSLPYLGKNGVRKLVHEALSIYVTGNENVSCDSRNRPV